MNGREKKMKHRGMLIVLSGFSGAGKGTVVKELVKKYGYCVSTSWTTRNPREGELDGREYHFRTREEFQTLIEQNGFIEWAQYVENYYGTPRAFVEEELEKGNNVILEIEVQGALNIKAQYPKALLLFITTKDAKTLEERLIGRGTEDMETIRKRLERAKEEVKDIEKYEYIIVNDNLDDCVERVHQIVLSESCQITNQADFVYKMQSDLANL